MKKKKKPAKVTKSKLAASISNPSRHGHPGTPGLTKAQWSTRGEYIRILKRNEYINAEKLSFNDATSAIRSVERCSVMRTIANHKRRLAEA